MFNPLVAVCVPERSKLETGTCTNTIYLPTASQAPPVTEVFKEVHGHVVQTLRNSAEEAVTHIMCGNLGRANEIHFS